jgi:hypothetical protein
LLVSFELVRSLSHKLEHLVGDVPPFLHDPAEKHGLPARTETVEDADPLSSKLEQPAAEGS